MSTMAARRARRLMSAPSWWRCVAGTGLELEIEILTRASAYFARENVLPNVPSSSSTPSTWPPCAAGLMGSMFTWIETFYNRTRRPG
jgi:hypothetical protein